MEESEEPDNKEVSAAAARPLGEGAEAGEGKEAGAGVPGEGEDAIGRQVIVGKQRVPVCHLLSQ